MQTEKLKKLPKSQDGPKMLNLKGDPEHQTGLNLGPFGANLRTRHVFQLLEFGPGLNSSNWKELWASKKVPKRDPEHQTVLKKSPFGANLGRQLAPIDVEKAPSEATKYGKCAAVVLAMFLVPHRPQKGPKMAPIF